MRNNEDLENKNQGVNQPSDSSKKAAGAVAGGAAEYFGAGGIYQGLKNNKLTGGAVDKLEDGLAKSIDKNPTLSTVAKGMDKSGLSDTANNAMASKNGVPLGSKGSGSELATPLTGSKNNYLSNISNNGVEDSNNKLGDNEEGSSSDKLSSKNKYKRNRKLKNLSVEDEEIDLNNSTFKVFGNVSLTIKIIGISLIILIPFIIVLLSTTLFNSVGDQFKDMMGYFQFKTGSIEGEEFISGNPAADEFYKRFLEVEEEYKSNNISVDGAYIMGAISIVVNNLEYFEYKDMSENKIREFFDAGIETKVEEDGTETSSFSKETFNTNVFDVIRKYLNKSFSDEFINNEISNIDKFIEEYYSFIYKENASAICGLTGSTTDDVFQNLSSQDFIQLIGPMAQQAASISASKGYTIFPSVLIAQAALESGWGDHAIHNNLFGIKCHGYERCVSTGTSEHYNGQVVSIKDDFRIYDSIEESIVDRNEFLISNNRYTIAGVFTATTPKGQVEALKKAGYATDVSYVSKLTSMIDKYNLEEWDTNSSFCLSGESNFTPRTKKPTIADHAFAMIDQSNRGQCVWYVRGRAVEVAQELLKNGSIDQGTANFIIKGAQASKGNGGQWYDRAASYGFFEYSNDIRAVEPGAIISWKQGSKPGHVAYIEDVNNSQGTITISEGWTSAYMQGSWEQLSFKTRTISLESYFSSFGPYYVGGYTFSGYVYTLKPKM